MELFSYYRTKVLDGVTYRLFVSKAHHTLPHDGLGLIRSRPERIVLVNIVTVNEHENSNRHGSAIVTKL